MSDRFNGEIEFGGKMTIPVFLDILEQVFEYSACDGNLTFDGTVHVQNYEARYGRLDELEDVIEKNGVPYLGRSDAYYEYAAAIWGVTKDGVKLDAVNQVDGDPVIYSSEIMESMEKLIEVEKVGTDPASLTLFIGDGGIQGEYAEQVLHSGPKTPLSFLHRSLTEKYAGYISPPDLEVEGLTSDQVQYILDKANDVSDPVVQKVIAPVIGEHKTKKYMDIIKKGSLVDYIQENGDPDNTKE